MNEADKIASDIKKGQIVPVYLFTGEEPYFIDTLTACLEKYVLSEDQKSFDQTILYGRDTTVDDIVSQARRYPVLGERQVLIVREAQELSRTIENLADYVQTPTPTTVLALCYKYKSPDKRKKLYKAFKKNGVVFTGKKLYDNQVPGWISARLKEKGYGIAPKASLMLTEFLGNDLGRIDKELEKLALTIPKGKQFTPELVEENTGISKDFNNFELQKAVGDKDVKKAFAIARYFAQNPKNNPLVVTIAILYRFFRLVFRYHALDSGERNARSLGVSPFFWKEYQLAGRNYGMKQTAAIIAKIRETDMKSKGVGAAGVAEGDLLKELLSAIFST